MVKGRFVCCMPAFFCSDVFFEYLVIEPVFCEEFAGVRKTMLYVEWDSCNASIAPQHFSAFVFHKISYIIQQTAAYPLLLYRWINRQFAELETVVFPKQ